MSIGELADYLGIVSFLIFVLSSIWQVIVYYSNRDDLNDILKKTISLTFPSYIAVLAIGFLIATFIPQQAKPVQVSFIEIANESNINVDITSIDFRYPNNIVVEGQSSNLQEGMGIWMYVHTTNNKYFIKDAKINPDGKWHTIDKVDIGDDYRFGGKYEVGILVAEREKCPELKDKSGIDVLPKCANKLSTVSVQR